jgi:AraC-like DNA-binding protein
VVYLEYKPRAPLAPWVAALWYCRTPHPEAVRQRVLPSGRAEIVLNLAAEFCTGCCEGVPEWRQAPALLAGPRAAPGFIDGRDLAETMGVSFAPGGLRLFFRERAEGLVGETGLDALWDGSAGELRERLCEARPVRAKFAVLEEFLLRQMLPYEVHPAVRGALGQIARVAGQVDVRRLAQSAGLSERGFREVFSAAVGMGPKTFLRVQRFRRAVAQLHAGTEACWVEMALDLGYCDQAHFNREFREFAGVTPTEYLRAQRPWAGHVVTDGD